MLEPIYEDGPVKVYIDLDPINPRENTEHTSILYCKNLIHEGPSTPPPSETHVVLPVYRYEHGEIALNTVGFHCPWDSGLTGYIAEPKNGEDEDVMRERLRTEVQIFSEYCNGEVYGFENTETGDSCWGFFGSDWNYMMEEARGA